MPELQTRIEHSRSLEDAERYRALHTLTELGALIPVTELETIHGRVDAQDDPDWVVDPSFRNGNDDTGNSNLNARPTLYTASKEVSGEFAQARAQELLREKTLQGLQDQLAQTDPLVWRAQQQAEQQAHYDSLTERQRQITLPPKTTLDEGPWQPQELSSAAHSKYVHEADSEMVTDEWRKHQREARLLLHDIVSQDTEARVLNFTFDPSKLTDEERVMYSDAWQALAINVTTGSPVDFDQKDGVKPFVTAFNERQQAGYISLDIAKELAAELGIGEKLAVQLAGAFNARKVAMKTPGFLAKKLKHTEEDMAFEIIAPEGGEEQTIPLNLEYVQKFFHNAHIVGIKEPVNSSTLSKTIDIVGFFDLERVNTEEAVQAERSKVAQELGSLGAELTLQNEAEGHETELLRALEREPHIKPSKLVTLAAKIDGFAEVYTADAGNWEGFTLAEHTQTVLQNFDENFADKLPVGLLAPMRLALLAHDLGKPIAVQNREKAREKQYNQVYAADFFEKLGVESKTAAFLLAAIGDGMDLAFKAYIRDDDAARADLRTLAEAQTRQLFGDQEEITPEVIDGYMALCKMLLICDGGAYTSMATTTRRGVATFRNAPSFNSSFARPTSPGRRDIKLVKRGQPTAPERHIVWPDRPPSRLRRSSGSSTAARNPFIAK